MKRRKLSKKLLLKKETVSNLNREELESVYGGFDSWLCSIFKASCLLDPAYCTSFLEECPTYTTTHDI